MSVGEGSLIYIRCPSEFENILSAFVEGSIREYEDRFNVFMHSDCLKLYKSTSYDVRNPWCF